MLNINDDMDDLIRQAADEYPLKTDEKDWNKVLSGIELAKQSPPDNNRSYWWLLLLLLPLIIAIPVFNGDKDKQQQASSSNPKNTALALQKQDVNVAENNTGKALEQVTTSNAAALPDEESNEEASAHSLQKEHYNYTIINKKLSNNNGIDNTISETQQQLNKDVFTEKNIGKNNNLINSTGVDKNNSTGIENNNPPAIINATNKTGEKKKNEITNIPADSAEQKQSVTTANTLQKDSATIAGKKKTIHTVPVKNKGLYAGMAAGLDVTTVKFHELDKVGYSTSVLVGYRLSNHWSIESGVMWDKKNYYSPGEYFDKSRTGIPAASYIHYLNGTCRMFEVPLNVKYDFNSKKLSGFYVAAGVSSYFMKKENYEYHATNNGNYYVGKKVYKNSTNNLFSVANINGGYQFIFKNNHSLRIEPYLKVPLKGLGIGKLPFSSTGISVAYTLPLH